MNEEINLDFQTIPNYDPKYLVIADTSSWGQIKDRPAIIEVTIPGFTKPITHYFDKYKVNMFNSINLYLNCTDCGKNDFVDLPDGIYTLTLKGSPSSYNITKEYLKTDKLRIEMDKMFSKFNIENTSKITPAIEKIMKLDFYIKVAESHVRLGDSCTAQELVFKVQKEINNLKNCKSCV